MSEMIPVIIAFAISVSVFILSVFRIGNTLFAKKGYEQLCVLPVHKNAIVLSRLGGMYLTYFLVTLPIYLSSIGVYAVCTKPAAVFYVICILSSFILPIIPIAVSAAVGLLIMMAAAGKKHQNAIETGLKTLLLLIIFMGQFFKTGKIPEDLESLKIMISNLPVKMYLPAVWFKNTLEGRLEYFLLLFLASVVIFAVITIILSANYEKICRRLFISYTGETYHLGELKQQSVLMALYYKERKRYFASAIYVSNTIVGPILATAFAMTYPFIDKSYLKDLIPFSPELLIPVIWSAVCCLMPVSSVSVSMEGKEVWILKSLPVSTKTIVNSKILWSLSIYLPAYIISEFVLVFTVRGGISNLLWQIVFPLLLIVCAGTIGVTADLFLGNYNWEKEEAAVKQSTSAVVGGFLPALVSLLCGSIFFIVPSKFFLAAKLSVCTVIVIFTAVLYKVATGRKLK